MPQRRSNPAAKEPNETEALIQSKIATDNTKAIFEFVGRVPKIERGISGSAQFVEIGQYCLCLPISLAVGG